MDTIIQDFAEDVSTKLRKMLENIMSGSNEGISALVTLLKEELDKLGTELCRYFIEAADEIIKESSKRQKEWVVERSNDQKTLATVFGKVKYERTYYKSKGDKGYRHLVDDRLGIKPHQRMDSSLEAKLVNEASNNSYAKVGKQAVNSLKISDQTVMNKIRKLEKIENNLLDDNKEKREVKCLYVEADEDHVALQNGENALPKLVYIHEGKDKNGSKNKLKNKHYFTGVYKETDELWIEVLDYIDANYKIDELEKIFIAGDGASWIKKGLDWLPKSKYILDKYHLNKYVLRATGHAKKLRFKLWEGLNNLDKDLVGETFSEIMAKTEKESKKKAIRKSRNYIYSNWDGIRNYYQDQDAVGCSAEGHISHVLADRLSSRPRGWSKIGVDQMARLRAFKYNGGDRNKLQELIIDKKRVERKEKVLSRIESKVVNSKLKKKFAEPKQNIPAIRLGKSTGLFKVLKSFR